MRPRRRTTAQRGGLQRYLGANEQVLLVTRQHPFALLRAALDMLVLLVPLAIAAWGIAGTELLRGPVGTWVLRLEFVVMVAIVARLAWTVVGWEFERVMVTEEKVIHVAGALNRRIASTPLAKVSEFSVRQPLLGRIFDYGSLVVDVPGGRDQALHGLAFLPDPAGMYRLVSDQARRGRVHEGGGRVQAPTPTDIARTQRPDPWTPTLEGDASDHTIRIPRIPPAG